MYHSSSAHFLHLTREKTAADSFSVERRDRQTDGSLLSCLVCLSVSCLVYKSTKKSGRRCCCRRLLLPVGFFLDGIERREWMGRTDAAHNNVAVISFLSQLRWMPFHQQQLNLSVLSQLSIAFACRNTTQHTKKFKAGIVLLLPAHSRQPTKW